FPRTIWVLSSPSSRELTALTLPWVPTGMNAGVSIRPCSVLSRPERAFVLLSVAPTSNIGGTLEMIAQLASNQSFRLREGSLWRLFYWTLLALVFAGAIWQRFKLPLDPIADPDTWGYLSPGLRKLLGSEFGHTHGRNFVYPGFVYLLLSGFGTFRAIVIGQHLLGLLAGGVLLLTWRHSGALVPNGRVNCASHDA